MNIDNASIAAIATAQGRGGIGVVRISGAAVPAVMQAVCTRTLVPRQATYLPFLGANGQMMDQGIALYFPAPHSYTGEAVLELQGHGGPVVLQLLLNACLAAGAAQGLRLAQPGEFTRRAFLNNKLDLAQAESVADLIEANTEAAARGAAASLRGVFSQAVHALVQQITQLRMLVEATLDFPEEEIEFLEKHNARGQLQSIQSALAHVLDQTQQGALLRNGLTVVLAGRPNVGKSSLLNALAGAERAIVTPIAGTTRDTVNEAIQIEGITLHIVDTAGLRQTSDTVEQMGIHRTWDALSKADVILHLQDASDVSADAAQQDAAIAAQINTQLPQSIARLVVRNKMDLLASDASKALSVKGFEAGSPENIADIVSSDGASQNPLFISAQHGSGINSLRKKLLQLAGWHSTGETVFIARERHLIALKQAREHLTIAQQHAAHSDQVLDLFAEELRLAQEQLSTITGEFTSDDLLGVIFGNFCIGK